MGLMTLSLATLNVRGLRDSSKCARLLGELKNLGVDVVAVQKTHFTCGADCQVLSFLQRNCRVHVFGKKRISRRGDFLLEKSNREEPG